MTWLRRLLHRSRMENRLDQEVSFHLEQHIAALIERGHSPEEARRLARIELGGPEQVKEACRDARGTRWLEDFLRDVAYALRTLRQNRGFAAVALLTLALGTGATTIMFTLIEGVVWRPFPYRHPERLLRLQEQTDWNTALGNLWGFTYPNYIDCKREVSSVDLAVSNFVRGTVSAPGSAEYVVGAEISSNLFSLLGTGVAQGREFLTEDDLPAATPVAIISHTTWESRFGAAPGAIGARITFDAKPYTIVGVMPAGFRLADVELSILTPIGQDTSPRMQNRGAHGFQVWGRLRSGTTIEQARSELAVVGGRLARQYPETNKGRTFIASPLRPDVGDTKATLWLLLGAVAAVVLIVCANIASLLLARAVSRERELAMRLALGASRAKLARQCLTESVVLAVGGGALGVGLASIGLRPFIAFWPGGLPRAWEVRLDWRVLLFSLGVSILSGLLFGMAPALRAPARDLEQTLRAGARTVVRSSRRLHNAFVVSEVALAIVLLVCAGMLGRMVQRVSALDPGLNVHNVLTARTALSPSILTDTGRMRAAWQDFLDRARLIPGVEAVAMIDTVPMRDGSNPIGYRTSPSGVPQSEQPVVLANCTTPDYLSVMGIPLRRGRFLTDQDRLGAQSVVVIDEVMAREAFPGQDPIGKQVWGIMPDPATVVGVVGHVLQWGLAGDDDSKIRAQLYYPFAQIPDAWVRRWSELMSIAVRTRPEPGTLLQPLRVQLRGALNDQVLYEVHTLEELDAASLARQRFLAFLFGAFAILSLLLACIGIYGVLAYLTGQRIPEIGMRMALGASAGEMMWLVLRNSLVMVLVGVVAGVAAAAGAVRLLVQLVQGMRGAEPGTFALMVLVLIAAATIASFLPAHRASRIDPVEALRQD
ncbi:MAG TPA: ABC transporter permease [Bryobacteraceae bacterium]